MCRDVLVVRDQEDRLAAAHEILEHCKHCLRRRGIQAARRFVGDQDGRIVCHGTGNRQPLLLTAGERSRHLACMVGNLHASSSSIARLDCSRGGRLPAKSIGSITFSRAVSVGSSSKA